MTTPPRHPKIYHIVHVDRLASIIKHGCIYSDAEVRRLKLGGTNIGLSKIKQRRLSHSINCHKNLMVGDCVPFYFCPRSVMLYVIHMGSNMELSYKGGQDEIVHLGSNFHDVVDWANINGVRWAFTDTNAATTFFRSWSCISKLKEINWEAVEANKWSRCKDGKQAEFLIEKSFPWHLVRHIGVKSQVMLDKVHKILNAANAPETGHKLVVKVQQKWYY